MQQIQRRGQKMWSGFRHVIYGCPGWPHYACSAKRALSTGLAAQADALRRTARQRQSRQLQEFKLQTRDRGPSRRRAMCNVPTAR